MACLFNGMPSLHLCQEVSAEQGGRECDSRDPAQLEHVGAFSEVPLRTDGENGRGCRRTLRGPSQEAPTRAHMPPTI